MSRKGKIKPEIKIQIAEECLEGRISKSEAAKDCIANGHNYGETALKYQVSYQQVYTWVKKFSELGEADLKINTYAKALPLQGCIRKTANLSRTFTFVQPKSAANRIIL